MLPGTQRYDQAIEVAVEHAQWCWAAGMSPQQVLRSLGSVYWGPIAPESTWDRVIWALAQLADDLPAAPQSIIADDQLALPLERRAA